MKANLRIGLWVLGAVVVVTFAWTVWPTPWRYHNLRSDRVREHRFTGELQILGGQGWEPLK